VAGLIDFRTRRLEEVERTTRGGARGVEVAFNCSRAPFDESACTVPSCICGVLVRCGDQLMDMRINEETENGSRLAGRSEYTSRAMVN